MGRSGIRRRKPPRHLPKLDAGDLRALGTEHSPWTVEGRIEAIGVMGRGLRDASPAQSRFLSRLTVATFGTLVLLGLAWWLVGRVFG